MRNPYLYDDVDVLKNRADIKDYDLLRKAEADITNLTMSVIYTRRYKVFNIETLCNIHRDMFGQIYEWAGEFRTIQMVKYEEVLGSDTVRYAEPMDIKKELDATMKEVKKLKREDGNERDVVFRIVRIIAAIWHTHPFREGNTRAVIVFAVLLAKHLGFEVDHDLFRENAAYVRNALVWGAQGIYSKYEYLENIFFDAILCGHDESASVGVDSDEVENEDNRKSKYAKIGDYSIKDYVERPHEYKDK